ncbi:MAG: HlyD family efflux transporter periplasmic adaptor subunit [Clostridia bacterium]|nr:HlyD family efflux transporter periplasmic adaptor subunit [Clostridia bacterium]
MDQNTSERSKRRSAKAVREKPGKPKKKKRIGKRILMILLTLILLGGIGGFAYLRLRQQYTVTYQEYTATTGTISNSLSFSGTLQLIDNAEYTASSSGTVKTLSAVKGQQVKAGDQLLRLNNGQVVEAEFDGTVNQLPIQEGDKVAAGDLLIQVVDFTHMKVSIRVDEYDISSVQTGDACRVTTTATENVFDSSIADINYVSSSTGAVAYYTATAYVDVTDGVYPGMQVTVTVPQEEAADVVVLREEALSFNERNQAVVYTMNSQGEMTETPVTTGVSNGNYVEIKSGLKAGDSAYKEVKEADQSIASMLTSLFGTQRINSTGGSRSFNQNTNRPGTNSNSNWSPGTNTNRQPSFGNGGGR